MTIITAVLTDPAAAPHFGIAGLAAQIAWPLFRSREMMLTMQLTASCAFATCYALMGKDTATAVCLTGAIQTTVALLAGDRPWLNRMGYVFLPVVLVLGYFTYAGLTTLLAVMACCLIMIGRLQRDTLRMRGVQLWASPFGAAHDICAGAWPGLAGAMLSFFIAITAFRREIRHRRQRSQRT